MAVICAITVDMKRALLIACLCFASPVMAEELSPYQQYIYYESGGYVPPAAEAPEMAAQMPESPYGVAYSEQSRNDATYYSADPTAMYDATGKQDEFNHGVRGLNF